MKRYNGVVGTPELKWTSQSKVNQMYLSSLVDDLISLVSSDIPVEPLRLENPIHSRATYSPEGDSHSPLGDAFTSMGRAHTSVAEHAASTPDK